jgi:hypothetical protein
MSVGSSVAQKVMHEAGALRVIGKDKKAVSSVFSLWGIFNKRAFVDTFTKTSDGVTVILREKNEVLKGNKLTTFLENLNPLQRAWFWIKGITGRISNFAQYAASQATHAVSGSTAKLAARYEGVLGQFKSYDGLTTALEKQYKAYQQELTALQEYTAKIKSSKLTGTDFEAHQAELKKLKEALEAAHKKLQTEQKGFITSFTRIAGADDAEKGAPAVGKLFSTKRKTNIEKLFASVADEQAATTKRAEDALTKHTTRLEAEAKDTLKLVTPKKAEGAAVEAATATVQEAPVTPAAIATDSGARATSAKAPKRKTQSATT